MFIRDAKAKADQLIEEMSPHCERIEIGGSIRRGCQIVNDIEIVAIPKIIETPALSLFDIGEPTREVPLHKWALSSGSDHIMWIKTGTSKIIPWQPKPLGRYWRALIDREIKLDLFLTRPEQWGAIFLIRTGSRHYSQAVMTYARLHTRFRFYDGALCNSHLQPVPMREELHVFNTLGLDYREPKDRTGWEAVKVQGVRMFNEQSFRRHAEKEREEVLSYE
jgi:DNA polymerase/3'-5' exonuclease PolX